MPSSYLILCRPLLLLPPIPPSIRGFSNESTLLVRWPKYWSFSFSISPSNNIVQEAANKTILKQKKSKKAKWLSKEALQIDKERREVKSKRERERHIQLIADFQNTARKDKKPFFNEQHIKLEENNRRGKIRDFFKKTGDIKGTCYAKMGTIKDKVVKN